MSEFVADLAETSYTDEELFALHALEGVVVDPSLAGDDLDPTFNSAT